jgi:hypothetical protein
MANLITTGGTPGITEIPAADRIARELRFKLEDAERGKIQAFWSVDIQFNQQDEPVPTVTIIADGTGTEEQREAIRQHMLGIADILREIYR